MKEKFLHVGRPSMGDRDDLFRAIAEVLDRNWLTNDGPMVRDLERNIAERLRVPHCVVVANGTVGLELAARALQLEGEIILPSFTFVATAHAMAWCGLKPVFCDIDPDTFCLDPRSAERLVGPATRAILGVHLYGRPCDTEAIQALADRHDLRVIYDASHAMGCTHHGQPIGNFGDCEVFSFHATKVFNSLEGGAITTHDAELASRLKQLRNFGFPGDGREVTIRLGTNAKMNEICAAVGLNNLRALDSFIAINKAVFEAYRAELVGIPGIQLMDHGPGYGSNYQYVIILVDARRYGATRDELLTALADANVLARRYFAPGCHAMEPYASSDPLACERLMVTEDMAERTLALPTGSQLSPGDIRMIGSLIRSVPERRRIRGSGSM